VHTFYFALYSVQKREQQPQKIWRFNTLGNSIWKYV